MSSTRVYLNVPFPKKDEAKQNGARFDGEQKQWYVQTPIAWLKCAEFLPLDAVSPWPDKDWQSYTYEQRFDARNEGCLWDAEARCWFRP
jgi:hypothetical protein